MKMILAAITAVSVVAGAMLAAKPAPEAPAGKKQTAIFQYGLNGYTGTIDIELWQVSPDKCLEGNPNATSDLVNGGGESQILVRFDDVIGDKPGQVPPKSTIRSAKMTVMRF